MRRVAAIALLAVSLGGCLRDPGSARPHSNPAKGCPPGSEWPQTGDAAWLRGILAREGFPVAECTGTAYVVRLRSGSEVYVWAFGPVRDLHRVEAEEAAWVREVDGTRVYGNGVRAVWIAEGRFVWVQAGPTESPLPLLDELSPLVAATTR